MVNGVEIVCYRTTLNNIKDCYRLLNFLPIDCNETIDDLSGYVGLPITIDDYDLMLKQDKSPNRFL